MPFLEGTDGLRKMSKSLGNYIALEDKPNDMFGKLMSISDALMLRYYELLTTEDMAGVKAAHPMEAKHHWRIDRRSVSRGGSRSGGEGSVSTEISRTRISERARCACGLDAVGCEGCSRPFDRPGRFGGEDGACAE